MKTINTYGINVNLDQLRDVAKNSINCCNGAYYELFYDRDDGSIWERWHPNSNEWSVHNDPAVIKIGGYTRHHAAQHIMDDLKVALEEAARDEALMDAYYEANK